MILELNDKKMKNNLFVLFIAFVGLASSCVSKKKYTELQEAKLFIEQELLEMKDSNEKLQEKYENTVALFNQERMQLSLSNAEKDKYIARINSEFKELKEKRDELSMDLKSAKHNKSASSKYINQLKARITSISKSRDTLKKEMNKLKTDLTWEVGKLNREKELLANQNKGLESQIEELNKDIEKLNQKIEECDKQKSIDNQEIEKLTNQVKLLKKNLK